MADSDANTDVPAAPPAHEPPAPESQPLNAASVDQPSAGDPKGPETVMRPFPAPRETEPSNWIEMKAWIRRELALAGQGLTEDEREAANP